MQTQYDESRSKTQMREKFAANKSNWNLYSKVFTRAMAFASDYINLPVIGPLFKKIALMDQSAKHLTQSYTFNLNYNLNDKGGVQNVVLPVDLIKKAIEDSEYRSVMHQCLCRTGYGCKNFDNNLGCIFIGEGAVATVKNGIAKEATVDEALIHLDKAMGSGLVGMSMWIEIENYIWGIKKEHHFKWLEICFCCPCCCIALRNLKKMPRDVTQRFRAMGWKALYTDGCDSCGICEESCPAAAIKLDGDSVSVSDQCLGCGICAQKCPKNALEMEMIAPQKENLQDYYEGFRPEV